jgi:hypothetical protein
MKDFSKLFTPLSINILLISLTSVNIEAQKIQENKPFPAEFIQKIDRIAFNGNIGLLDPTFLTYPKIYGASLATYVIAKKVQSNLEKEVAEDLPSAKDTLILKDAVYKAFHKVMTENGSSNSEGEYTLKVTIIDHGFNWASSSAMGVYINLKVDLLSYAGDKVWEQIYFMDKKEKKRPYNKKAMTAKGCIEGLVKDYQNNPDLLPETYDLICQILASKFLPTQK